MKILYASGMSPNDTSLYRLWALERLGHTVVPFNSFGYESSNETLRKIIHRLCIGPGVTKLNQDLLQLATTEKVDVVWADKLLWMQPKTIETLRSKDIYTLSYMIDNAFGPRQDPGFRLYRKSIRHYDLHVVQRDKNITDYRDHGARDVIKIQTAYEPTLQYPPPPGWDDSKRDREVSFIGTPYDNRPAFLTRLWREYCIPVRISGNIRWKKLLDPDAAAAIYPVEHELYRDEYREGIWRSKINLSFITHSNGDEFVHKSFEIAGCGGFLLAERSEGHLQRFVEGEEAVFFSTLEECAEMIQRYLPDEAARARIAAAGCRRAERDGYTNDRQVELIVERIERIQQTQSGARTVVAATEPK
jgi:spore maturation protein CgeB